jgi:hypothetical protein
LKTTWNHPFLVQRDGLWIWQRCADLRKGDNFRTDGAVTTIDKIKRIAKPLTTYNLHVAAPAHTFFVEVNNKWVLVHNKRIA